MKEIVLSKVKRMKKLVMSHVYQKEGIFNQVYI